MHNTQTDYTMQLARYNTAVASFNVESAHLVYPDDSDSPEWDVVFDAEEVIRHECHLDTLWALRTESEDRLIAWSLTIARETARGDAGVVIHLDFLEGNAWKPTVRKQLLDLALRLEVVA